MIETPPTRNGIGGEDAPWHRRLVDWFRSHRRLLPWRNRPTPYRVWVSEIMLQQTRVETARDYFERFITRFPSPEDLARADSQDVLRVWEGLGYYSRARNLHRAARRVMEKYDGRIPSTRDELLTLPGIGEYTAGAIASIAFGAPEPAVDGNAVRVMARFHALELDSRKNEIRRRVHERLREVLTRNDPGDFNQALMELGALVCKPRSPDCPVCPLRPDCLAFAQGRTQELPIRSPRAAVPRHNVAVGVVWHENRLLIARRPADRMLGGLWEFPGGKQEAGEELPHTVRREVREEVGLDVTVGPRLCTVKHAYTHFRVTISAFTCTAETPDAVAQDAAEVRWVKLDEMEAYPFPRANRRIIEHIKEAGPPKLGA